MVTMVDGVGILQMNGKSGGWWKKSESPVDRWIIHDYPQLIWFEPSVLQNFATIHSSDGWLIFVVTLSQLQVIHRNPRQSTIMPFDMIKHGWKILELYE